MGSSIRQSATLAARPSDSLSTLGRRWAVAVQLVLPSVPAIAAILVALPRARAAAEPSTVYVRPGEERSGALLLRRDGDRLVEALLRRSALRRAS
jgi:hypothetical protein